MPQDDFNIENQTFPDTRVDLNAQFTAIVSNNSGPTEPTTTFAFQWWADTTTGLLKIRNAANDAFIVVGVLADVNLGLASIVMTTKGDLRVFDASPERLVVGSNKQVLEADSAEGPGVKWGTPALTLLGTQVASNSVAIDFESLITSAYDEYEIHFHDLLPATDAQFLELLTSTDNGSSYDTSIGDYSSSVEGTKSTQNTYLSEANASGGASIILSFNLTADAINNTTGQIASGKIIISNPLSTTKTLIRSEIIYISSGNVDALILVRALAQRKALEDVDAIRLLMQAGNIVSGTFKFYGVN